MRLAVPAALFCLLALAGCDRFVATSELSADSSYKRTVKFSHQVMPMGDEKPEKAVDFVKLHGEGWTSSTSTKDTEETLTATRTVPGGQASDEATLLVKGTAFVKSQVSSTLNADGTVDYTETYEWVGPVKSKDENAAKRAESRTKMVASLRRLVPSLTEAQADQIAKDAEAQVLRTLLGPSRPKLMQLMTQPELTLKTIRIEMYEALVKSLLAVGGMVDLDETRRAAREFVKEATTEESLKQTSGAESPDSPGKGSDDPALTLVQSEVRYPGKVVWTDGEQDPVDGSVFWAFYAGAAKENKVVLKLRVRP